LRGVYQGAAETEGAVNVGEVREWNTKKGTEKAPRSPEEKYVDREEKKASAHDNATNHHKKTTRSTGHLPPRIC